MNRVEQIESIDCKVTVTHHPFDTPELAQELALAKTLTNNDDPVGILNLSDLIDRYTEWTFRLPRVQPFYAVKCNNDLAILWTLSQLGCGFDCASKAEIDTILGKKLATPENIIYANPCKTRAYVTHASNVGVRAMTFDNKEELVKVKSLHKNPQLLLRIAVADVTANRQLNTKFGCNPTTEAPRLLEIAKEMGLDVVGIAFHVGSGCRDPTAFQKALRAAKNLFEIGNGYGHKMGMLDIGGGFPGFDNPSMTFEKLSNVINPALDEHFPPSMNVRIIAEPGRFFATHPVSLIASIISAVEVSAERITGKAEDKEKPGMMYYINDGVYGFFNCILLDHYHPQGSCVFDIQGEKLETTVWGPTCDGTDQVEIRTQLPQLDVGDWLLYRNMGAYTVAAASKFNGFDPPKMHYFIDNTKWEILNGEALPKIQ